MKGKLLVVALVPVITVLVSGLAYADVGRNRWCAVDPGWKDTTDSPARQMMESSDGSMRGPYAGHMGDAATDPVTVLPEGKIRDFDCPGRGNETGSEGVDTGSESGKSEKTVPGRNP